MLAEVELPGCPSTALLIPTPAIFSLIAWTDHHNFSCKRAEDGGIYWDGSRVIELGGVVYQMNKPPIYKNDTFYFSTYGSSTYHNRSRNSS